MTGAGTDELRPLVVKQPSYLTLATNWAPLVLLGGGAYILGGVPLNLAVITLDKADRIPGGFEKETLGKSQTFYWVGWAFGCLLLVPLVDLLGRRVMYFCFLALGILTTILLSRAQTAVTYAAALFFVTFTIKPAALAGFLLVQERLPANLWSPAMVVMNVLFATTNLLLVLVGGTAARDLSWRIEVLLWHIPFAVVLVLGLFFLGEPPQQARHATADSRLSCPADGTRRTSPLCRLFCDRELRNRLLATIPGWVAATMGAYGLSFSSGNLSPNLYLNLASLSAVDLISYGLSGPTVKALGARRGQIIALAVAAACLLVCGCLPEGSARVAVALLGRFALDVAFTTIYVLLMMCFPVECRGTATGCANFCGRIMGVITPLFSFMHVSTCCFLMSAVCLFASVTTWFLPDSPREEEGKEDVKA